MMGRRFFSGGDGCAVKDLIQHRQQLRQSISTHRQIEVNVFEGQTHLSTGAFHAGDPLQVDHMRSMDSDELIDRQAGGQLFEGHADQEKRVYARAGRAESGLGPPPHIASICSQMPNMTILKTNVTTARDRKRRYSLLQRYTDETKSHYCAG